METSEQSLASTPVLVTVPNLPREEPRTPAQYVDLPPPPPSQPRNPLPPDHDRTVEYHRPSRNRDRDRDRDRERERERERHPERPHRASRRSRESSPDYYAISRSQVRDDDRSRPSQRHAERSMHEQPRREGDRVSPAQINPVALQATKEDEVVLQRLSRVMREAHRREWPRKGSRSAPRTWDGQPDRLPQFLEELRELFDDYRIEGRERVPAMLEYVDTLPEGMIRELKGFRDRDFELLTEELKDLMGRPRERAKYRFADLEAMTNEAARHSFKSEQDFQPIHAEEAQGQTGS
ncbi:hypothetical protein BN14_09686 [Rhizoctonia solani AG-1 IB]|uniref:Uncharacterized protein n=1 Tax=Thanatephorus cucumeris (strain AG1-IB / isolate 7/3/14) TaxID=1108050 RepID=M5C6J7_THACB|nr:hypothetical protein BN14_09686 [Rhizoctonia solani AG-1 IB]